MALLLPPSLSFPTSPSCYRAALSSCVAVANLCTRSQRNLILEPKRFNEFRVAVPSALKVRRAVVVHASSETEGNDATEPAAMPSDESNENVPVQELPLESKLQLKLEQKLRMKLAKKIRLRRKRLLRKRRMRKKGRWPPSKMKKLKNV